MVAYTAGFYYLPHPGAVRTGIRSRYGEEYLSKQQDKLLEKVFIKVADHFILHYLKGFEGGDILLVGAHRSEGIVDISQGADMRVDVDTIPAESAGIAVAVLPFMMLHGNYSTLFGQVSSFP